MTKKSRKKAGQNGKGEIRRERKKGKRNEGMRNEGKRREGAHLIHFPDPPHELINSRSLDYVHVVYDIVYRNGYNVIRAIYRL